MFLKFRLQIRNFFKKYRKIIFWVIVIWLIVIAINYLLGRQKPQETLNTTYTPHEVVLKSDDDVPEELYTPINDLIDDYITKCNNKDYQGAFELLTDDCKTYAFDNSVNEFKEYVDITFNTKKRYSIQDYSNYDGIYIYNLKIIDDILETGLTNTEYAYYEEKIGIETNENGDLKLRVNDFMSYNELKRVAEDDYLKIRVEDVTQYYESQYYTIRVTNKTDKIAILYDGVAGEEAILSSGEETRLVSIVSNSLVLEPGETKTVTMVFSKYYDESTPADNITFNKIRIMNTYTGEETTEEEELNNAEKTYSVSIPLK